MDNDFRFDPFQEEDDASFNTTEIDLIDTIPLADLGPEVEEYYEPSAAYDGSYGENADGQYGGESMEDPDWQYGDGGEDMQEQDWQYGDAEEDWQYEDRRPKDDLKTRSRAALIIIIAAVLVIAILTAASLITMRGRQAEAAEEKLLATVEEIRANVNDGQFDDAMQKVNTLIYTRSWPDGMQEKWDGIRADMTDYVNSARAGAEARAEEASAAEEEAQAAAEEAAEPVSYDVPYYTELCRETIPFDNVSVLTQGDVIYATFWQNGYGDQALYALENGGEARQNWDNMINDIRVLNSTLKADMSEHGFAEYNLVFALLNDLDTRLTLVEFTNGEISYDALRE